MTKKDVRVRRHERWYHGSSLGAATIRHEGVIRPGMPTKFRQDIPRSDAVYVTKSREVAVGYTGQSGSVFEVRVDESKLIPDEDQVFEILADPKDKMYSKILAAYAKYNFNLYGDGRPTSKKEAARWFENLAEGNMSDPFTTALAEEMKDFVDWILKNDPALARDLVDHGFTAAHLGPVEVI